MLYILKNKNKFKNKVQFKKITNPIFFVVFSLLIISCKSTKSTTNNSFFIVDTKAKPEVKKLYNRIKKISEKGYAFGHQDAAAYGIGWKNDGKTYKSDVHEVTGSYPAVYGFDLGHLELDHSFNLDTVHFKLMKKLIKTAHKNKGIITISWHPDNPLTNKSSWDTTATVKQILRGGKLHYKYRSWLKKVADFMKDLRNFLGPQVPVVFRPLHEMNGGWFWWGASSCTTEQYKRLWRETVYILKDEYKVHNLLYLYSPNTLNSKNEFLKFYPGDEYVDILGLDIYQKGTSEEFTKILKRDLGVLKEIAIKKNKPFALSESGYEKLQGEPKWWTQVLHKSINNSGVAWALFWRNAWKSHFYVPYKGQETSEDFKTYEKLPKVLFLKDIKKIE